MANRSVRLPYPTSLLSTYDFRMVLSAHSLALDVSYTVELKLLPYGDTWKQIYTAQGGQERTQENI